LSFVVGSADRTKAESTSLRMLPATFSYSDALKAGISEWQLYGHRMWWSL